VLLRKAGRAEVATQPDFVGFDIPDEFVVGYGLDFDGAWRHLPYLAVLDEDEIAATRAGLDATSLHDAVRSTQADPPDEPRA
jgi:hypoxanthine phosphoribosyltransferase